MTSKQCNSGFGVRILPFSQFLEKSISSNGIGGNKTKGQEISEANFLILILTKFDLASKMSQIKKMKALYYIN